MQENERWTLEETVYRAAEYGGGTDEFWQVPENATIKVTDERSTHMLDGAVIAWWR